jgi:exonuclease VII small subunit
MEPLDDRLTFDIESAEARLDEAVASVKRHFAALEEAVEHLKRSRQNLPPSPSVTVK